jgi:thiol-disulfide isomerase/thioredoxin
VGLVALCLGLAGGCALFGKKPQGAAPKAAPRAPGPGAPSAAPASRTEPAGQPEQPTAAVSPFGGILAGQVIDSYNRRPPPTHIQVVPVKGKDSKEPAGAPIEVAADANGYFTIQGLQPGRPYQLIARARDGERQLAGMVWATPPDPRLLIRISEDFVAPNTAEGTASPAAPRTNRPGTQSSQLPPPSWPDGPSDAAAGSLRRAVELGQPVPRNGAPASPVGPAPAPPPATVVRPEYIGQQRDLAGRSPAADIPNPFSPKPGQGQPPAMATVPGAGVPTAAAPVPFCVLTGRKLDNFALTDLNGQPWEFRKNRRGRLVLLDFWWTMCRPCLEAIPHLSSLQQSYGPYGLEVIGIAYESGTFEQQANRVKGVRDRMGINYRLLLGGPQGQCPVKNQFQVERFPTLILLDETGQIVMRKEGLDSQHLEELKFEIRRRLGLR